jgi:hypothetical protein
VEDCQGAIDYVGSVEGEADFTDGERNQLTAARNDAETCLAGAAACRDQQTACEQENDRLMQDFEAQSGGGQETIGLIVAGVGGAVLIGAIIHDAASQGTIDDYEDAAVNGTQEEFNDLADDIDSAKTLSYILYGLGIVGVGTGAVIFLTAGPGEPPQLQDCGGLQDMNLARPPVMPGPGSAAASSSESVCVAVGAAVDVNVNVSVGGRDPRPSHAQWEPPISPPAAWACRQCDNAPRPRFHPEAAWPF